LEICFDPATAVTILVSKLLPHPACSDPTAMKCFRRLDETLDATSEHGRKTCHIRVLTVRPNNLLFWHDLGFSQQWPNTDEPATTRAA
jgi:hypothetical protein